MKALFKKELESHAVEIYHPKLVASSRELEQFQAAMQDPVLGAVHVKLPIPVQTEVGLCRSRRRPVPTGLP